MEAPTPIKGRCGTCDWPTNSLPCAYCAAVARAKLAEIPYMMENTPEEFERVRNLAWPAP